MVLHEVKPQPENTNVCTKCNGTGFYCMGYINGQPYSQTGFTCYKCAGKGYTEKKKRVSKEDRLKEQYAAANTVTLRGSKAWIDEKLSSGKYENKILKIEYTD